MRKIIRPSYPTEITIGLLLLIFVLSFFLSSQLFTIPWTDLRQGVDVYMAMLFVSCSVVAMILIIWEELLFPIKVVQVERGMIFRNHPNKLLTQLLLYISIPIIFSLVYIFYEVKTVRFLVWAAICGGVPIVVKLISGVNNYWDFLTLTQDFIAYKDNAKEGTFSLTDIQGLEMIKDDTDALIKLKVKLNNTETVVIDLDAMELEDFYDTIEEYLISNYTFITVSSKNQHKNDSRKK